MPAVFSNGMGSNLNSELAKTNPAVSRTEDFKPGPWTKTPAVPGVTKKERPSIGNIILLFSQEILVTPLGNKAVLIL